VGIATAYTTDGPGIESRWGRDIPNPTTGHEAQLPYYTTVTGLSP